MRDPEFENALDKVLSLYGTQLQSHAATIVSLSIGVFALFTIKPTSVLGIVGFSLIVAILLIGIAYTGLRLIIYGNLSKAILYGSLQDFTEFREKYRS